MGFYVISFEMVPMVGLAPPSLRWRDCSLTRSQNFGGVKYYN